MLIIDTGMTNPKQINIKQVIYKTKTISATIIITIYVSIMQNFQINLLRLIVQVFDSFVHLTSFLCLCWSSDLVLSVITCFILHSCYFILLGGCDIVCAVPRVLYASFIFNNRRNGLLYMDYHQYIWIQEQHVNWS